ANELARELAAWGHGRDATAGREELGALVAGLTRTAAPPEDEGSATTVEQQASPTAPGKTPPISRDPEQPPTAVQRRSVTPVPAPDSLALLAAVDGAICVSAGAEPSFPPESAARLASLRLEPEAKALGRYLLASGELPPRSAAALGTFLRGHPAFSPGANGWA